MIENEELDEDELVPVAAAEADEAGEIVHDLPSVSPSNDEHSWTSGLRHRARFCELT